VEWLASASHASPSPASSEAPLDPGSGNSEPESNAAENRQSTAVAATSSLDTADRSHDSLEPSKTQIRKLSEKHESKAGKPGASKKSKTPSKNSVKENAASSGIAKSTAKHRAEAKGREKRQSSGGDWSVNLMSFPDEAVAKKQVENMSRKGISAAIQRTNISGKNWYRVRIPGFKSKQEAQDYSESVVRKLGLSGTWVSR
ncbi:MAG: SPOR domain-containing protein, partial [Methylococcales bacterium]